MSRPVEYRFLEPGEEEEVCGLVRQVFDEFVAPDLGPEGIAEFFDYANPRALAGRLAGDHFVLVATRGAAHIGMIEMARLDHVAMLFVSDRGEGIATELLRRAVRICRSRAPAVSRISVHASPYAEPAYRRMGFRATGGPRTENGITYVPMILKLPDA